MQQIVKLSAPAGPGQAQRVAPEKLIHGNPLQTLWLDYSDATQQFFAGWWRSEPGKWKVAYTEEEFCQLLHGRCVITGDDGSVLSVGPGDSFVIPRGFVGTWEVVETTTKRFVIYEAAR
jgi:uncharacterized cupin superfamily protein